MIPTPWLRLFESGGLMFGTLFFFQATPNPKNPNMDCLNDGACWTIISTEKAEYCWSDSAFNLVNNVPVTPVPVVRNLEVKSFFALGAKCAELAFDQTTSVKFSLSFVSICTPCLFR